MAIWLLMLGWSHGWLPGREDRSLLLTAGQLVMGGGGAVGAAARVVVWCYRLSTIS